MMDKKKFARLLEELEALEESERRELLGLLMDTSRRSYGAWIDDPEKTERLFKESRAVDEEARQAAIAAEIAELAKGVK